MPTRAWLYLGLAGLFEVAWAVGLKYSRGFSLLVPSVLTLSAMGASFLLLAKALEVIPVGTGYAVWTGIGAVGTAILGIWLFDEPRNLARLVFLGLIIAGIVGLKMSARSG